ncbi:Charged multivesicular body protein 7 [Tritrichomonas musculus]|uniref:Charged multivesicular body protein 7 n=1 Tax=Tritrichomonas musculus TaxID=1915356 RepID=A0ABR2KU85_9EUKA
MIYLNAYNLFRDRFNEDDFIPLFRDLQSRGVNPEVWDRQVKFWSSFITKWGMQYNIIDFSVNQLMQALEFHEVIPHIQPSIENLAKQHVLISRDSFVNKESSFIKSFASKLFGFASSNDHQSDIYIFVNNLKNLAKEIISDVEKQGLSSMNVVLTNDEIRKNYLKDGDFEYLKEMLKETKQVKAYKNGFYFQTEKCPILSSEMVNHILNLKNNKGIIERELVNVEKNIKNELERARQFKKQNKIDQAKRCLIRKRNLEKHESDLMNKDNFYFNAISQLSDAEYTIKFVESTKQNQALMKNISMPDVSDIENAKDDFDENNAQLNDLNEAIALSQKYDDDSELERELEELTDSSNETVQTMSSVVKFKPVQRNPCLI